MSGLSRRQALLAGAGLAVSPAPRHGPRPYGALPSPRQLGWQALEYYGFLHFTVNTFTDREWGLGDESPSVFAPSAFDADQIVSACKAGGMRQLILTAKHHDGFCLWPSQDTEHCIRNSPFQDGHGDIVRDISLACRRHGLKFGIYLSPWDRNHADYGRPAYVDYYARQLEDLLTRYGPVSEIWFDGANGGDGYYGGAYETRRINGATYYQWPRVYGLVRRLQPDAVMFRDYGTDIRWVGNETGEAGDPCWPTTSGLPFTPQLGNHGVRGGALWNPAEVDVSIRPGWFWHAGENRQVRSPANLMNLYMRSAGRDGNLLLNVPPDRSGRIATEDADTLRGFGDLLARTFGHDLAGDASRTSSSGGTHGGVWTAREDDRDGAWLQLDLPRAAVFDVIRLREDTRFGVRIDDFVVEARHGGAWTELARHTCIGIRRLIRLDALVEADAVRLKIRTAAASPVIAEFGLFKLPAIVEDPVIRRDADGMVTLSASDPACEIAFNCDGSPDLKPYAGPFALAEGGVVRAAARLARQDVSSAVITRRFLPVTSGWTILACNGDNGQVLLGDDAEAASGQCTAPDGAPLEVLIDLGQVRDLTGIVVARGQGLPFRAAAPAGVRLWLGHDVGLEGAPVLDIRLDEIENLRACVTYHFPAVATGRYLRAIFSPPRQVGKRFASIARLNVEIA